MRYGLLGLFCLLTIGASAQGDEPTAATGACNGLERWPVKVLTDAAASTINYTPVPITLKAFCSLPAPTVTANSSRWSSIEDRTYKIKGRILIKKEMDDNDYQLVFSDGVNSMFLAMPDPFCLQALASPLFHEFVQVRKFIDLYIMPGDVINVSLPMVEVTGVAYIGVTQGLPGSAPNNMELHPVLDIHFASTGVDDIPEVPAMVSPNPFKNRLHLDIPAGAGTAVFSLFDVLGRKVYETKLQGNGGGEDVLIPELPAGVYAYQLLNGSGVAGRGMLTH